MAPYPSEHEARQHLARTADLDLLRSQMTPERLRRLREAVDNRQGGLRLFLEAVWDPHNLTAISRSADAFGLQFIEYTSDKRFDPATLGLKSSGHSHKWITFNEHPNSITALRRFQRDGWHIAAALLSDRAKSVYDVDWTVHDRLMIVVGNEREGISPEAKHLADTHVVIPMRGMVQSLNVSVATAIIIGEITRQRAASGRTYPLPKATADALYEDFIRRSYAG